MSSRRDFVKKTAIIGAGITIAPSLTFGNNNESSKDRLNVAFIGVGLRGTNHLNNVLLREDVNVVAICDIDERRNTIALEMIAKAGQKKPKVFGENDYDYRNMLKLSKIDAVIISTPWLWHTRMAKDSMRAGKYTAVEVSASNTMEE